MLPRVLLIMPRFRGYEKHVKEALSNKGFLVDSYIYSERDSFRIGPFLHLMTRALFFLFGQKKIDLYRSYFHKKLLCRHNEAVKNIARNKKFDYLLVIKGYGLKESTINDICANKKILYQWDSLKFYPSLSKIYSSFNEIYTFDPNDVGVGKGKYLPNFLVDRHATPREAENKNTALYIGEYSYYRYFVLRELTKKLVNNGVDTNFKLICTPMKYRILSLLKFDRKIISNNLISPQEYSAYFNQSKYIIEMSRVGQNGRTQRYYEGLSSHKCIILVETGKKQHQSSSGINIYYITKDDSFDIQNLYIDNWLDIMFYSGE